MSLLTGIKRLLIGRPIATKKAHHERLPVSLGLPVFASDALSSVAYASEEILLVLVVAGAVGVGFLFPTSLWLAALMIIVAFSYYQTIHAYPAGGGTYLVSTENLGSRAGRAAAAALLIDYVLTVAVSVSSGVAAIVSMFPGTQDYAVPIGCGAIAILCIANLRGAKESGVLFAIPTYSFVVMILILIITSLVRGIGQPHTVPQIDPPASGVFEAITPFLLLRAFAASCTALTGTEAIADGVQAFKPPEPRNAAKTLMIMVGLLLTMFIGLSWAAMHYGIVPIHSSEEGYKTVVAQLASLHFGEGVPYYLLLGSTALILFLAANTAFADFPRLSSFVARDGYMPRQLGTLGDRLVFQNGIILLAAAATFLVWAFHADTHSLIPLYAMGVFISFTLSQAGMTVKFKRSMAQAKFRAKVAQERAVDAVPAARIANTQSIATKMIISATGCVVTAVVTVILLVTKFKEGAWLIVVAMAAILAVFAGIRRHYNHLAKELSLDSDLTIPSVRSASLLLVPRVHRGILKALAYARASAADCRALHVTLDPESAQRVKGDWTAHGGSMPLVILESPYRSLTQPIMDYIDQMVAEDPDLLITVIVPQAVPRYWWQSLLHTNAAIPLKLALGSRQNVVITNVRYFLK